MAQARIFGPVISTYVRIVEIVCEEAGITHQVVPTPAQSPQNRHPFGKVPVVELDGLELSETAAIARYIDAAHNGAALQPQDPQLRYVMDHWIAVNDSYLFPLFEHGLVMPYIMHRHAGAPLDQARIERALPNIAKSLEFLELELAKDGAWSRAWGTGAGAAQAGICLADIFLYVTLLGLRSTPEGREGIAQCDHLSAWMAIIEARPSVLATRWEFERG
jgi:glutathione S-transferase